MSAPDAAVAAVAMEIFGSDARKALELMNLIAGQGGRMDAEDPRLDPYCDNFAGYDTFNHCCDAGYIEQVGTRSEGEYAVVLLKKGTEILALQTVTAGVTYSVGGGK